MLLKALLTSYFIYYNFYAQIFHLKNSFVVYLISLFCSAFCKIFLYVSINKIQFKYMGEKLKIPNIFFVYMVLLYLHGYWL